MIKKNKKTHLRIEFQHSQVNNKQNRFLGSHRLNKAEQIIFYLLLLFNKYHNLSNVLWIKLIFCINFSYLIREERQNISSLWLSQLELVTIEEMKPWHWANTLPNINICENRRSNFSSFRVMVLKFAKLILFALPNHWFFSISYMLSTRKWRHHKLSYSSSWECIYLT